MKKKENRQFLRRNKVGRDGRMAATTSHLTKIITILEENPQGLIFVDFIEYGMGTYTLNKALLWLVNHNLIERRPSEIQKRGKGGCTYTQNTYRYYLKEKKND